MSAFQKLSRGTARASAALSCALALLGCGTHSHALAGNGESLIDDEESAVQPLPRAAPVPEPSHPEARAFGSRYATPAECEAAARALQATSRDSAWTALKSCVNHTHFTLMGALLSEAWEEDLRVRPDAAPVLAHVVAMRGGSVPGELSILQEHKVPIFALSDAIAHPDVYKGRYLMLRAQVADIRSDEDKPTVWLVEETLHSVQREQPVGYTTHHESVREHSGGFGGDVGPFGRANLGGQLTTRRSDSRSYSVPRYDNVSDETGREALGRMASPDPFFAPGKDFVVLARFDGLRTTSGGEGDEDAPKLAVLTIVSYHAPHPLVVY